MNRGMRRERYSSIVRYRVGNDFTLVIPPVRKGDSNEARKEKEAVFKAFRKVILSDRTFFSGDKNNEYWNNILLKREIVRDGRSYYKFNVTLTSYPERSTFDKNDLSRTLISNAIKFGVGLNVALVFGRVTITSVIFRPWSFVSCTECLHVLYHHQMQGS